MKKIFLAIIALVLVGGVGSYFYISKDVGLSTVEANPDYICKKAVIDQPCVIETCEDWKTDGTRTCNGKRTTEVSYYLIRTTCEAGYTQVAHGEAGGASGRQAGDYVSGTQSCTIVEVDNVPPVGDISE